MFISNILGEDLPFMISITECKSGNTTYYKKTVTRADGEIIQSSYIYYKAVTVSKNGIDYFLIYDSKMKVKSDAFTYVNQILSSKSRNTQIKAHEALKFLYSFEEIIGKELGDFTPSDVDNFKYFLHGYTPQGNELTINSSSVRGNDTVNEYLSVYRGYLQHLGITSHCLFTPVGRHKIIIPDPSYIFRNTGYDKNDATPKHAIEVPKYITVEKFVEILEYVREHYSLREEIIIRLMYQCGLRIGEVLGLTADDLVMEQLDDGTYAPMAYLRNRLTDKPYQHAKSCMQIVSRKQYQTQQYNTLNFGYQFVIVPQDLFDLINKYIEDAHSSARDNVKSNVRYMKKTVADRVRPTDEFEDINYYIFLNSIGTPLSIDSWNRIIRDIFRAVGIHVDKGTRKNNLNHRFRHGFAMFHAIYLNTKAKELARQLRHSDIGTVMCYYNPTITQQVKLKTDFADALYKEIPSLQREE